MSEIRENLDHMKIDARPVENQLSGLNAVIEILAERPTDAKFIGRHQQLQAASHDALESLNQRYSGIEQTIRMYRVAAHAINGGTPHFLDERGNSQPMEAMAFFNSFEILEVPNLHQRLYVRSHLGMQVFWSVTQDFNRYDRLGQRY